jgi:signal transduction histidine kinase
LVSRFTLEGVKLSYEIFDISDAIENILNNFVPEMKLKRLVVKKDIRVRLVYADKEGINTVLENLISNGIKFSEPDTNLEIKTCIINENNQEYFQFKISNHGIGIPEDQLEKIFEPFYQVDATTSRRYGGIGLGLSIARNIIEAHQGKIWAESRGGVTCFYFKIPNRRV